MYDKQFLDSKSVASVIAGDIIGPENVRFTLTFLDGQVITIVARSVEERDSWVQKFHQIVKGIVSNYV
jgi:chemotaxis receptor (MCP) glutamine deamidase CheD